MATPTLSNVPTLISNADSTTGWTGEGGVEPDIKVEGTNSIYATLRSDGSSVSYTSANFTGTNQHVRGWIQFTALGNLDFMEMNLNNAYWQIFKGAGTIGGLADTPRYRGGWFYAIIEYNSTPDTGTKSTPVTSVGFRFQRESAPRNVINTYVDALYFGDGYTATGGTSGDPITFTTISDVDVVSAYGIVQNIRDTNFLFGEVTIGSGATATYMKVANEAVIFADAPVSSILYKLVATGSGCTFDATNSLFKANGLQIFDFDVSAVGTLICNSNVFIQASPLIFGSGQTITSNTFIDCGTLTTGGATITRGAFENCAPVVVADLANLSLCTFVGDNTQAAVELTSLGSGTMDWSCTASAGYATGSLGTFTTANDAGADGAIFVNVASGTLTISVVNGGTVPSIRTAGATVVVEAQPTLFALTGMKDGTEVRIMNASTRVEICGVESMSAGVGTDINNGSAGSVSISGTTDDNTFTYSYQYGGSDIAVEAAIIATGFEIQYISSSLTNTDKSIPVQQQQDRNYNNP